MIRTRFPSGVDATFKGSISFYGSCSLWGPMARAAQRDFDVPYPPR